MKALLFSGGLDSSALAWWLRPDICVTVNYGHGSAKGEIAAATALAKAMSLEHEIVEVDLSALGSGSMAGKAPAFGAAAVEFWPYRNQMLVTLAAMMLQPKGLTEVMVGAVATDRHADGRSPFFRSLSRTMELQEGGVCVTAPARHLSSIALLKESAFPHELVGLTFSCHLHEYACGQCGGCLKHREVVEKVFRSKRRRRIEGA
jgi:7-cyano-7-deazaguanine synthase